MSPLCVLPIIENDNQFLSIRAILLYQPTQLQVVMGMSRLDMNNNQVVNDEEKAAVQTTTVMEQKDARIINCLLLHYTHEKRFSSYKQDLHQIWSEIFVNTPAFNVKVIVGNRNNSNAKTELVRKRPKPSLLTIKDHSGKYQYLNLH